MPDVNVMEQAVEALDRMAIIVKNEQISREYYVSDAVDPEKADQICGGRQYCAIGALWVGAGLLPEKNEYGHMTLPGVDLTTHKRREFAATIPPLAVALDALNEVASDWIVEHDISEDDLSHISNDPIEQLFEGYTWVDEKFEDMEYLVDADDVLTIIERAKARVLQPA